MTIVQINTCADGSTGTIMLQTAQVARNAGHTVFTFSRKWRGQPKPPKGHAYFGSFLENAVHQILGNLLGFAEHFSPIGTWNLIQKLKRISPDVIHLHNLHGWYIHLPLLFRYIKKHNIRVIWTLHDCWAFTGQCPHFEMAGCDRWKTGCHACPQLDVYPASRMDQTKTQWKHKKAWFTGINDLTIVTPSEWLANLVKQSFLKEYPVKVIPNGIDLSVFKPTESNFKTKHRCEGKNVLLGVASAWGARKGLDVFARLANRLDDRFQIVLVGTTDEIDKRLPANIVSIHKTADKAELAAVYSAADLFVNPTREDTLPTVNMEALACGTPVLTFETGGSPEIVDSTCGCAVAKNDLDGLEKAIVRICNDRPYTASDCVKRGQLFDSTARLKEYVKLYEDRTHCAKRSV